MTDVVDLETPAKAPPKVKKPKMKRAPVDIPVISREVVLQAQNLSQPQIRFMVSNYYMAQDQRKRGDMQLRHLGDKDMPEKLLKYWSDGFAQLEQTAKDALGKYANAHPIGQWMMEQMGVGPICAAGLLGHLDITRAQAAGNFWSFAGLNPNKKWEKGEKRPFNPKLKQICFHLGQEFKKLHNKDNCFYGKIYEAMKAKVVDKNERGENAERAKRYTTNSADVKRTLKKGKLPAGNLDKQACNQAVKIFLSHLHAVWYWHHYGVPPARPFAFAILGHAHEIKVPNMEMFPGFEKAYYGHKVQPVHGTPQRKKA